MHQPTILLVEDDPILREMYVERLGQEHYQVIDVGSGEAAQEIISRQLLDVILLDIMLPGVSGLDLLALIREQAATKDLPVVLLSALGTAEDKIRGQELGATIYLAKAETTPGEVINEVKKILH